MNRRNFFRTMIGGVAAAAAVRTWPFRVYSFPTQPLIPDNRIDVIDLNCWGLRPHEYFMNTDQAQAWQNLDRSMRSDKAIPVSSRGLRIPQFTMTDLGHEKKEITIASMGRGTGSVYDENGKILRRGTLLQNL